MNQKNVELILSYFPTNTDEIRIENQNLSRLPSLVHYTNLRFLNLVGNPLQELPMLPEGLLTLHLSHLQFDTLPVLPSSLKYLQICKAPKLTSLPVCLPSGLTDLGVEQSGLQSLPELPPNLVSLVVVGCNLTHLPQLPTNLETLNVNENQIETLPTLPSRLQTLKITYNPITQLPKLPPRLVSLDAYKCKISHVPSLPFSLKYWNVIRNPLWSMDPLPEHYSLQFSSFVWAICDTPLASILFSLEQIKSYMPMETEAIQVYKTKLFTLSRFRDLYYALKYKRQFRDWLWLRVRLPHIERDNHPALLQRALDDVAATDSSGEELETVMNTFGRR